MSNKISKNFSRRLANGKPECECHCGCGLTVQVQTHIDRRQRMRDIYGKPMILTSSTRCRNHPAELSKSEKKRETASHPKGYADDIQALTGGERMALFGAAYEAGYRRIGINVKVGFIHIDDDPDKLPSIWVY